MHFNQARNNERFTRVVFQGLSTRLFQTGYSLRMRKVYAYAANESTLSTKEWLLLIVYTDIFIAFDEGERIANLVLGVLCFARQKTLRFSL